MIRLVRSVMRLGQRFRSEERGVAAVEFALIMPLLISLYFGSMEAAALFTVDKRINSISGTIGDLVAQWDPEDGAMPTATMTDYLNASTGLISPYPTTGLKIVVSYVKVTKTTGVTSVLWSRANSAGTAKGEGNAYTDLPASSEMNKLIAANGGCVIATEVIYSYLPMLGQVFKSAVNLKHTNYFLPRFGSTDPIDLQTKDLAANACTT
jgi:Flp pilus assembly protein TadG